MASRSETDKIHEKFARSLQNIFSHTKRKRFFSVYTRDIWRSKEIRIKCSELCDTQVPRILTSTKNLDFFSFWKSPIYAGERLTVAVLYRLIYIYKYYDYGIIKDILEYNHYHVQMHDGDPIICVIPLLPEKFQIFMPKISFMARKKLWFAGISFEIYVKKSKNKSISYFSSDSTSESDVFYV